MAKMICAKPEKQNFQLAFLTLVLPRSSSTGFSQPAFASTPRHL